MSYGDIYAKHFFRKKHNLNNLRALIKGTVQWELRWVKIGISQSILMYSFAGNCPLQCPNGHHHERSIYVFSVCSTF
jgi:hypothetical protein